jgi:predicted DCC family thiol-disulfide oxidoreductase YuxK
VQADTSKSTVFFDGSCPLCQAEIGHYRRQDDSGVLCFVDVSKMVETLPENLSPQKATARFHVLAGDGQLLSGAAAFVRVWSLLPQWRWAARTAAFPGAMAALEVGYRLYLPVRPTISRIFRKLRKLSQRGNGAARG